MDEFSDEDQGHPVVQPDTDDLEDIIRVHNYDAWDVQNQTDS